MNYAGHFLHEIRADSDINKRIIFTKKKKKFTKKTKDHGTSLANFYLF